jgi:hypothetical protein
MRALVQWRAVGLVQEGGQRRMRLRVPIRTMTPNLENEMAFTFPKLTC